MDVIKWTEIEGFHNIRKLLSVYPELLGSNNAVRYRGKIKLHGVNAAIQIHKDGAVVAQSRTTILTLTSDNVGFAKWVETNKEGWAGISIPDPHSDRVVVFGEWCFTYDTPVLLADGTTRPIGLIVNGKEQIDVLSYNFDSQKIEPKKIIGWSKKEDNIDDWVTVEIQRRHRGGKSTKLIVTKNHKIFSRRNNEICEINAGDLIEGDIVYVAGKQLSYLQYQFIMGSLLGDGSFSQGSFCVSHSDNDQPFYNTFISNFLGEISSVRDKISGFGSNMKEFLTYSLSEIKNLENILIQNGIKTPTVDYLNKMHPPAFAAWYMDDGSLTGGHDGRQYQCELSTLGYTELTNKELVAWFCDHGFDCYINTFKRENGELQFFIRFSPSGTEAFQRMIASYVINDFDYKLAPQFREIPKINWEHKNLKDGIVESKVTAIVVGNPHKESWKRVKYDITVEDNHNFFANRTLVHNCGPGIQKGVAVNNIPNKIFAVFAIQVLPGDTLIVDPEVINQLLPNIPDVYVLPWYGPEVSVEWLVSAETLQKTADFINELVVVVEKCDPWVKDAFGVEGTGEGIVYYPISHPGRKAFGDLCFKAKGEKHKVVNAKAPVQVDPEKAANAEAFANLVLTEARLEQGAMAVMGEPIIAMLEFNIKNVGKFIGWISKDVEKETKAELEASGLEWKQVAKIVSDKARVWYLERAKTL